MFVQLQPPLTPLKLCCSNEETIMNKVFVLYFKQASIKYLIQVRNHWFCEDEKYGI